MSSASKRPFPSGAGPNGDASGQCKASFIKKTKIDDDDSDYLPPDEISMSLIDEMDALEEEELMRATDVPHPLVSPTTMPTARPQSSTTPTGAMGVAKAQHHHVPMYDGAGFKRWRREPAPPIDPDKDVISFQQIDIDHYIGAPVPGMPGLQASSVPILRMFGVTMEGNSVCAHLHGFLPYFYVPLPCEQFGTEHCSDFRSSLNDAVAGDSRANKNIATPVLSVEICQRWVPAVSMHFKDLPLTHWFRPSLSPL